jgi:class 3 adenylate cyclase
MLRYLSIQSKLIVMLLAVSLMSIGVIGAVGYFNGRAALTEAIYRQLTGIRQTKTTLVANLLRGVRSQVVVLSDDETCIDAMKAFRKGFAEAASRRLPEASSAALDSFYRKDLAAMLAKTTAGAPVVEALLPTSPAARHLQFQYIAGRPELAYEKKSALDSTGDGSAYDAAHARFHRFFRDVAEGAGFEDLMLVDADTGDIIYTVQKTVEFGTSLATGPYSRTNLGRLFQNIRGELNPKAYRFVDFEHYPPNLNRPASFVASPIFEGSRRLGILVAQFPLDEINRAMTGDRQWEKEGLGQTGEAYLVGADGTFRSRSRFYTTAPEETLGVLKRHGVPPVVLDRVRRNGTLVLNLRVDTEGARRALKGETGITVYDDYRGEPVLAAFGPLDTDEFRWGVLAEVDASEAFAPVYALQRRVAATTAAVALAVTLLALLMAHYFVRPVAKLAEGARRVSHGDVDVTVEVDSHDEFRELADAFNDMTRSLKAKTDELRQKVAENEELLLNILPAPAVARFREGESQFTQSFADVTVLFADFCGFEELNSSFGPDRALALISDLVVALDEAAEDHGVEKVKSIGSSYLAVCGLSEQRPDHANRMVDFALEAERLVRRFNQEKGTAVRVAMGINAGPVVGGLVGRNRFIYDLWGDTVTIARGLSAGDRGGIHVTRAVHDRLADLHPFETRGDMEVPGKGPVPAWAVAA